MGNICVDVGCGARPSNERETQITSNILQWGRYERETKENPSRNLDLEQRQSVNNGGNTLCNFEIKYISNDLGWRSVRI